MTEPDYTDDDRPVDEDLYGDDDIDLGETVNDDFEGDVDIESDFSPADEDLQ
jgi:hypothetical protein